MSYICDECNKVYSRKVKKCTCGSNWFSYRENPTVLKDEHHRVVVSIGSDDSMINITVEKLGIKVLDHEMPITLFVDILLDNVGYMSDRQVREFRRVLHYTEEKRQDILARTRINDVQGESNEDSDEAPY